MILEQQNGAAKFHSLSHDKDFPEENKINSIESKNKKEYNNNIICNLIKVNLFRSFYIKVF